MAGSTASVATTALTRRAHTKRIAAIDIGSNSIRQIVADISPKGEIFVVDEMKSAPRLGTGLDESGVLPTEGMDRAVDALGRMATLAKQFGAVRIDAVATSAVRDAKNAELFLARVRRETGLRVRIVDGEEEARLCFRSALAHFELGVGRTVVMDIGGGSLELAASADGVIEHLASLPLGAIRMTERYLRDAKSPKALKKLRREVRRTIRPELPVRDWKGAQIIGSGGTFTNLAGIYLSRQGVHGGNSVHGTHISRGEVEHILEMLASMTPSERLGVPGLNPDRADIVVAGLAVAAEVMARIEARDLTVSRYGIREGILLEAARVRPTVNDPGEARERSVAELAARCHFEASHANAVQKLSLRLFDSIGARLGCSPGDRRVLADAALLHDIGYHISYERHHKHSYHLILHAELLGMSPTDRVVVANVARYHRGAAPRKKHQEYASLGPELRTRIKRLSAILRVTDGFDRGHVGAVADLHVRWNQRALRITPVPSHASALLRLETWGAHRKSQLLAELAGVPVEIVAPGGSVLSSADAGGDDD